MENSEEVLENLIQYDKNPTTTIPQILETYLEQIAKTGYTRFPWHRIKTLFKVKLENVIADFSGVSPVENVPAMPNVEEFKYEEMKTRIFEQLESYSGVPFTIQRICELITQPYDYYKRIDKFMRGLERVMLVVTTIDPDPVPAGGLTSISNGFSPDFTINMVQDSPGTRLDEAGSSKAIGKSSDEESGVRRPGDSLDSPAAKRIRLSEVEEDVGPCDSADQVPPPMQNGSPPGNECLAAASLVSSPGGASADNVVVNGQTSPSTSAAASVPSTSAASSPSTSAASGVSPSTSAAATSLPSTSAAATVSAPAVDQAADSSPTDDNMEIDIECTSSYRLDSNPESSPKQDTREAMPETQKKESVAAGNSEAENNNAADSPAAPTVADAGDSGGDSQASAGNSADETDGSGEVRMDTECAAEEGISTSGERGSAEEGTAKSAPRGAEEGISTSGESGRAELSTPQQVENNSEAEASGEAETFSSSEKAEELPTEERMASEAQEIVVSSEATVEPRVEELAGAADSSDQVAAARQQPCEVEGAPDQSQCPAESIQPNTQAGEAIEESAEAASVSPAEESGAVNTAAGTAQAAAESDGDLAAPSTEAVSVAGSSDGEAVTAACEETPAASNETPAAEESGNEAVECGAAAEEKNDSPDQSL